jgi:hypothetical protein
MGRGREGGIEERDRGKTPWRRILRGVMTLC